MTQSDGISTRTIIAGLFVSIIPSTMDIFGKIILDEFDLPFLSIVVDAVLLFTFVLILFLYTTICYPLESHKLMQSPFWITNLFNHNTTHHLHYKCIVFLLLLALFWSGNCIFTYLATLCDVPSFVGMLKGFVSPSLLFVSWLFGGKEQLTLLKVLSIFMYAMGQIMIDYGEVSFSINCLFLATIAVMCTTGKYLMIEKVLCCKLPIKNTESDDPYTMERDQLIPVSIEMIHLNAIENTNNKTETHDTKSNEESESELQSISSLLAFAYILPPQIIIGIIVFVYNECEAVLYNEKSASYTSARDPWFWYSRLIQNSVFLVIYWAEIHLVGQYSALYMMVFGAIRNVMTLILSRIAFNYKLTAYGWIGYCVAILAVSAFQYAKKFDDLS
eukprot:230684_1